MQKIKRLFGKACKDYSLLSDGDKILVAISGGKDSLCLLQMLARQSHIHKPTIRVEAAHVVMENIPYSADHEALNAFCQNEGIRLNILRTSFDESTDPRKTRCFLCAWNRRKALFKFAEANGFNKVALGHHQDDFIVTSLMNLFYEGAFTTMQPLMQLEHYPVEIIRPLCLIPEKAITELAEKGLFPKQTQACPYEQTTQRNEMEKLFHSQESRNPEIRHSIWRAISKTQQNQKEQNGKDNF